MSDLSQKDKEQSAKGQAIFSGFRNAYSAYSDSQFNYWYKKTLSDINNNLVKNGPTTHNPVYDNKCSLMKGTVAKMNGKDMAIKTACVGFKTPEEKTYPLDSGLIEITKDSRAYMELTDIEDKIHKFSDLLFKQDSTGTTTMWRSTDSSKIMKWIRSTGYATSNSGGTQDVTLQGTVNGAMTSDAGDDVILSNAATDSSAKVEAHTFKEGTSLEADCTRSVTCGCFFGEFPFCTAPC
jgi:hypothetical protein